jgi:hypothetical protein
VARQTVHQRLRRYANEGGLGALADRSPKPDSCPHQMSVVTEARVMAVRREHPGWGPSRIRWQLEREGTVPLPGRSSVYQALVRHGLVEGRADLSDLDGLIGEVAQPLLVQKREPGNGVS